MLERMLRWTRTARASRWRWAGPLLVLLAASCGNQAAVAELEQLREKTCGCGGDGSCIAEAKELAQRWVATHGNARGVSAERIDAIVAAIAACDSRVARTLQNAARNAPR